MTRGVQAHTRCDLRFCFGEDRINPPCILQLDDPSLGGSYVTPPTTLHRESPAVPQVFGRCRTSHNTARDKEPRKARGGAMLDVAIQPSILHYSSL